MNDQTMTKCPHCGGAADVVDLTPWGRDHLTTCTTCHQVVVRLLAISNEIHDDDESTGDMPRAWADVDPALAQEAWDLAGNAPDTADGDYLDLYDAGGDKLPALLRRMQEVGIAWPAGIVIDPDCDPTTAHADPVSTCPGRDVEVTITFGRPESASQH
ncbi:hypothetical protein [Stackebrandtia soli]|uniref:hypothetical protein n=1 Tax=Stackebrandtia soli TaxID=1892856 RepID=UPI0039ED193C